VDRVLDTVYLDDSGRFKIESQLGKCGPARLSDGNESTHLYFCPGDSVHISLNTKEFDESIQYSGKGASKNNFLAEYYLEFGDFGKENFIDFFMLRDTSVQEYLEIVSQDEIARTNYLEQSHRINNYPTEFIKYIKTWIHFFKMDCYMYLFYNGGSLSNSVADSHYVSQVKNQIISGVEYNDPDYLAPGYQWWLYVILPNAIKMNIIEEEEELKSNTMKRDSVLYSNLAELLTPYELQLGIFNEMRDYSISFDLIYFRFYPTPALPIQIKNQNSNVIRGREMIFGCILHPGLKPGVTNMCPRWGQCNKNCVSNVSLQQQ
jgi:hypothetical protein